MSKTATLTVQYLLTGDGDLVQDSVQQITLNAAGPTVLNLAAAADNTVLIPSGFTVTSVVLKPSATSTNVKSIKATTGDSNPGAWTSQPVIYPLTGLTQFVIHSAGSEAIEAWYE